MQKGALIILGAMTLTGAVLAVAGPETDRSAAKAKPLALTAEQKGQIDTLRSDFRKAEIRRQADLRIARIELRELMSAATINDKAVLAKMQQVSDLQAADFKARTEHHLSIAKILTPEQRAKFKGFKQRRHLQNRGQGRMGHNAMRPHRNRPQAGPGPVSDMEAGEDVGPQLAEHLN